MKTDYINFNKTIYPFAKICDCDFGRKIIKTKEEVITSENIVEELRKARALHIQNAIEIDYLNRYYSGDEPILYRKKKNRPEINNRVVLNLAQYIVDVKTSAICGDPIQYVLHGTDQAKADQINQLNALMDGEDKPYFDIELCRWRSICGTAYRFVGNASNRKRLLDESAFYLDIPDPRETFVCYYADNQPAFGCIIRKNSEDKEVSWVYTPDSYYKIIGTDIIESGINGNGAIPIIEYPNNARRISDIELTISITDELNKLASDRSNGIESYVQSWIKFINCDIDIEKFRQVRDEGFFSVTSNNGAENRSDVDIMSQELNQSESQVAVDDLFQKMLIIQGIANREGNTGGDTGAAVELRNGHSAQEEKSKLSEPVFKRSEREMLRLVLNRLRIEKQFTLVPSDIEIKITRSKNTNMLTKAEVLKILLECGVEETIAIKTIDLFDDPERVATVSKERMAKKFAPQEQQVVQKEPGDVDGEDNED